MVNRLCLGTVQFGMDYGIRNKSGRPNKSDVFEMLDIAAERGIRYLDTAAAYGNAETLLGEYRVSRGSKSRFDIISKLKPNLFNANKKVKNKAHYIELEIIESLNNLNLEMLNGFLLHTPLDFYDSDIMEGLIRCKEKGLVEKIGVSIYEFSHAMDVVSSSFVDYIQVPYSIFDQRMDRGSFFEVAKKNNVKVFGRSAFLQGLLLMDSNQLPQNIKHAKEPLEKYEDILTKYKIENDEGAISFSYQNLNIDYLVFGVDNREQLIRNLDLIERNDINKYYVQDIKETFSKVEKSIIFPSLWAKE